MRLPPTPARDRLLESAVTDLLTHDPRLADVTVSVHVDGGVVQMEGVAAHQRAVDDLRDLVGRLGGVVGIWDRVRLPGQGPLRCLDVGVGGTRQHPDNIGLDVRPGAGVDVVADLDAGLPLADGSVDRVYAVHVLEHVADLIAAMAELHRVLAPSGVLHVLTPHWGHVTAVADPTHVRLLDVATFKYFCVPGHGLPLWRPIHAATDGATVFADLQPVAAGVAPASDPELVRWFD